MRTGKIEKLPVYLDGMIWEATAIHTAYPEYLNSQLRTQIFQMGQNPFLSRHIQAGGQQGDAARTSATTRPLHRARYRRHDERRAGHGVRQGLGDDPKQHPRLRRLSGRRDAWAGKIQKGPTKSTSWRRGKPITVHIRMNVENVDGFSGHSDRRQLINYIATLEPKPERIIIGHGEEHKCTDLASALYKKFNIETRAPMNLETIRHALNRSN